MPYITVDDINDLLQYAKWLRKCCQHRAFITGTSQYVMAVPVSSLDTRNNKCENAQVRGRRAIILEKRGTAMVSNGKYS